MKTVASGAYALLITPFDRNMDLDEERLRKLVRRQIKSKVQGIAPLGVTGENPSLTERELKRVIEIVVEEVNGKCKVAPDTCTNNLSRTITCIPMPDAIMQLFLLHSLARILKQRSLI